MNSNVSSSPASSRKRRAVAGSLVSSLELTTTPHRAAELHGEASVLGSATSMSCDTTISSQQRCTSTDSSPSFKLLQSEYPISPGTPQKNFLLPVATTRKARRWRSQRCCNARALILMLAALSLLVMCWVAHTGSEVAPYDTPLRQERAKGGKEAHRGSVFSTTKVPKAAKSAKSPAHTSTTAKAASTTTTTGKPTTTTEENLLTEHPMSTSTITVEDSLTANNTVEDSLAANITVDDSLTANTTVEDSLAANITVDDSLTANTTVEDSLTANITVEDSTNVTTSAKELEFVEADANRSTWAVLVQHEDAAMRRASAGSSPCVGSAASPCPAQFVDALSLPSWTLHAIPPTCETCPDPGLYAAATRNVSLSDHHGVFASVLGPLGRVGPMLFAMSSVTNEVPVREELAKWTWLRHVYPALSAKLDGAKDNGNGNDDAPRASYLAVMGVPSTDQPARVALREAQRATWLTYQEVARTENDFTGALLPLYLFAAVEPLSRKAMRRHRFSPDAITPSVEAFAKVTAALRTRGAAAVDVYEERRVTLRANWREEDTAVSPCRRIATRPVTGGFSSTPLSYLSDMVNLSITPAAVAPAQFICHASAGLWQEALKHRNVVWIDMMTDRRPTTDKKLGDIIKWGLPVEVGMSQKLILWLEYAYHAFPDTPYIIKGDDDAYLKVPQFLRDIRYIRAGAEHRDVSASSKAAAPVEKRPADVNETAGSAPLKMPAMVRGLLPECVYWGSMRSFEGVMFNAGMTFMAHRKLVQGVLGPASSLTDTIDIVHMAVQEFDIKRKLEYRMARLHQEDILLGLRIHAAREHAAAVCAGGQVWYVMEGLSRFHDMHRGKMHDVTWSTVVAHRCTPADTYFLHHYFQQEYRVNQRGTPDSNEMDLEQTVAEQAAGWVAGEASHAPASVVGWEDLPSVLWVHPEEGVPAYEVDAQDNVAVYHNVYQQWQDLPNNVTYGYRALPNE